MFNNYPNDFNSNLQQPQSQFGQPTITPQYENPNQVIPNIIPIQNLRPQSRPVTSSPFPPVNIQEQQEIIKQQQMQIKEMNKNIRETEKKLKKLEEKYQQAQEFLDYSDSIDKADELALSEIKIANKEKKETAFKKCNSIYPNFGIHKDLEDLHVSILGIIKNIPHDIRYIRGSSLDNKINDAILYADCAYVEHNNYFKLKFVEKCRDKVYQINFNLKSFLRYGNCGSVDKLLDAFTKSAKIFTDINNWMLKIARNLNISLPSIFITLHHPSLTYEQLIKDNNMYTDSTGKLLLKNGKEISEPKDIVSVRKHKEMEKKLKDKLNSELKDPKELNQLMLPENDNDISSK